MNYLEEYKVAVPEGQRGPWRVERFTVGEHDIGRVICSFDGRDVLPGTYTRLIKEGEYAPTMSDTPAEISDHLWFIHRAQGKCLINGLGLGVVLRAILKKPEVTQVDIVEIDLDVINLVWPTYQSDPRCTIHHDDAYSIIWPKHKRWDCAWHNIWASMCTDNLEGVTRLKRKYGHRVAFQAAWCEDFLRREKRRDRWMPW
jgi:spermidine synthase